MNVFGGGNRTPLNLSSLAAHRGGEGEIRLIPSRPGFAAKIFARPDSDRESKLTAMLTRLPSSTTAYAFAAPVELLYSHPRGGECIGYVMTYFANLTPLFSVFRKLRSGQLSLDDGLRVAVNIAQAFAACHGAEIMIGDCNDANILVANNNQVILVDVNSFQIHTPARTHRCCVGRAEYTPPELQGVKFATVDRRPSSDAFGLAILVFGLLMRGHHSFASGYRGAGNVPPLGKRIQRGLFPHVSGGLPDFPPKASVPPFSALPMQLQFLFRQCFEAGHRDPSLRPTAQEWCDALGRITPTELKALDTQSANGGHASRSPISDWLSLLRRLLAGVSRHPRLATLVVGLPLLSAGLYAGISVDSGQARSTRSSVQVQGAAGEPTPRLWCDLRETKVR